MCSSYSQLKVSTYNLHKIDKQEQKVSVGPWGMILFHLQMSAAKVIENARCKSLLLFFGKHFFRFGVSDCFILVCMHPIVISTIEL